MALVVTFCNRMEIRLVKRELRRECVLFAQVAPPDSIVLPSDFFPDELIATHVSVDSLSSLREDFSLLARFRCSYSRRQ